MLTKINSIKQNFSMSNVYSQLIISVIFFSWFAIFDQFPILMGYDTSGYIDLLDFKPFIYGLFTIATSAGISLWLTVFIQSMLLSYVLIKVGQKFPPYLQKYTSLSIIITCCITPVSVYASSIHPDIFTAILCVSLYLLITTKTNTEAMLYTIICSISMAMHMTNIATSCLCICAVFIVFIGKRKWQKIYLLVIPVCIAISIIVLSNVVFHHSLSLPSKNSDFYLAGLAKHSILYNHLQTYCPKNKYILCEFIQKDWYKDAYNFAWNNDKASTIEKKYSADIIKKEYRRLFLMILLKNSKEVLQMIAYESFRSVFMSIPLGNLEVATEEHYPMQFMQHLNMMEVSNFRESRQIKNNESLVSIANVLVVMQKIVFILFIPFFLAIHVLYKKILDVQLLQYMYFILLFIACNTVVSLLFSDAYMRYFSRLNWLVVQSSILVLIYILCYTCTKKNTFYFKK